MNNLNVCIENIKNKTISWEELLLSAENKSKMNFNKIDKDFILDNLNNIIKFNIKDKNNKYFEFAILDLYKEGKIKINDKINDFLNSFLLYFIYEINQNNKLIFNKNENNETILFYLYGKDFKKHNLISQIIKIDFFKKIYKQESEICFEKNKNGLSMLDLTLQNTNFKTEVYNFLYKKMTNNKNNLINNFRYTDLNYLNKEIFVNILNLKGNSLFNIELNKEEGVLYKESFFDFLINDFKQNKKLEKILLVLEYLDEKKIKYQNVPTNLVHSLNNILEYLEAKNKNSQTIIAIKHIKKIIPSVEKLIFENEIKEVKQDNNVKTKFKI